ncbi:hypothetical protein [Pedobacter soli]|uniref:DUF4133 domain-containing protein n=1 Tax=Pedobacter soli TaxID=390242 RepID=A0A1G6WYU6_9SPHI|nr:hypothetical protein [Pedobacter soli]SDD70813.1 hypothetical protein SAMN04488024_107164 [Pedobacter soli]
MNAPQTFPVYKGLQKPLSYKGLKGKFIAWGAVALVGGLILGGTTGAFINMYLGAAVALGSIGVMLYYVLSQQKKGLHSKSRHNGIFIQPLNINIRYENKENL